MTSLAELNKRVSMADDYRRQISSLHITVDKDKVTIYGSEGNKVYVPNHTGALFHHDDAFVRGIMGPFGSGKTTCAIEEIVIRACNMPIWHHGRRRSRWGIVRNTTGELESTTLQSWITWFDTLGDIYKRQKPILKYEHAFNDGYGIVELELLFIALDRPEHVRKIKSLELTGVYFNELSEIPKAAFDHMKGRVNRYPSKSLCAEPYWSGIIFDTNPPEEDHWLCKLFEEQDVPGHKLFKQPPGLLKDDDGNWIRNPNADNASHLPDDYYLKLSLGQNEEFIKVFCLGKYGTVGTGKLIFTEFNADVHAVDSLTAIQGEPLILGWDFGLTPACIVLQLTQRGTLMMLKEYLGDGIGLRSFAESVVLPGLLRDFPYCKVGMSVGDPAGTHRNEIMEEMSCIGELCQLGINTIPAETNDIAPRLAAVRYFLNKMIDGKPAFIMDRKKCPVSYKGFLKEYYYQRLAVAGEERYKDKPHKNMASHPMDAIQYPCLHLASDRIAIEKISTNKVVDLWNPVARMF